MNTVEVTTRFNLDQIEQTVSSRSVEISRRIIQLQDQGVREALVAMGWTPPPLTEPDSAG